MNAILRSLFSVAAAVLGPWTAHGAVPTEFAGIPFGSPAPKIREVMTARPDATFKAESPGELTYADGTFVEAKVETWRFKLVDGKFRSGAVTFALFGRDSKGRPINDQTEARIVRLLQKKYGPPKEMRSDTHREYNWSFKDALRPATLKTIRFYHGWGANLGMHLTYEDAPIVPAAVTKPKDQL